VTGRWAVTAMVALTALWPAVQPAEAATTNSGQQAEASATVAGRAGGAYIGIVASPWGCSTAWGGCARPTDWRLMLERQRRFDDLRQDSNTAPHFAATNPWHGWSGAPLPPPTPEKHIQPAYRDRSVLRPEYREDGPQSK